VFEAPRLRPRWSRHRSRQADPVAAAQQQGRLSGVWKTLTKTRFMIATKPPPAKGIERNPETKRKRYATPAELQRLMSALDRHPDQQGADIFRLCMLTGCRSHEAMSARWDAVDLDTGVWTKPGATTKQRTDHVVPLSAPARQLLVKLRRQTNSEWVFPAPDSSTGHRVTIAKSWRLLCKTAKVSSLRAHDLRHSFASQLASGGASLTLIGALLGHTQAQTTHRYAHLFDDPQRAAVERVGKLVTGRRR
jgi:integrase